MKEEFDFESIKNKAIEQLKAGKPLLGKDGAFAPLLESILNAALEGEMDAHLTEEERQMGNRRNGKMQKQVQTPLGEVTVSTPRDRNSSFDPQFIKKRETILAEGVADRIIGLYAMGNSTREISDWMEENLGNRVSADTISSITDRVLPEIKAWKSRMLDSVYPIVWMDAIHYKVTDERGCAVTRAIYNVLSIDREGHKELLGMYISRNEGANFWLSVLTDLQNRGVEDILIACIDGLKGFPEAIQSVYPNTAVQLCVVHQIRNSIKYVGSKNQKEFLRDLKCVYQAVNKESAENELLKLDEKWGEQYPVVIRSWQDNWDKLSEYFQYTPVIRKLIYTTNTVEGYHRQIRKVTKNKGVFPSDTALEKLVYLAYRNIRKNRRQNVVRILFFAGGNSFSIVTEYGSLIMIGYPHYERTIAVFCRNPIFTFQTELQRTAIFLITMRLHCQFIANKFQWIHIIFHIRKGASNIFRLQYYPLAGIILNREQRTIAHSMVAATGHGHRWSFAHKHHSVDRHLRTVIHPSAAGQSPCGGQHQCPGAELEKCSAVDHSNAPPVSGIT